MIRLKDLLKEVGDTVLPYKKDYWGKDEIVYKFILEDGTNFEVTIFIRSKNKIEVDFQSDFSWETTNRNKEVFKIFSTIKHILIEVVNKLNSKKFNIDTLIYDANSKKARIYQKLIQYMYPNAKFNKNQYGSIEASFK